MPRKPFMFQRLPVTPLDKKERFYAVENIDMAGADRDQTALLLLRYEATVRGKEDELCVLAETVVRTADDYNDAIRRLMKIADPYCSRGVAKGTKEITVNGEPKHWRENTLTHADIIKLAFGNAFTEEPGFTISFRWNDNDPWRTVLTDNIKLEVQDGMIFRVDGQKHAFVAGNAEDNG